jgi:hypothetical protein
VRDITPVLRACCRADCDQENPQPISAFRKDKNRRDGLTSACTACLRRQDARRHVLHRDQANAKRARYRKAHPDHLARTRRAEQLWQRYRMRLSDYEAMLEAQGGVCARCGKPERVERGGRVIPLSVDHDHDCCPGRNSCGKCVRQLLCVSCNLKVGVEDHRAAGKSWGRPRKVAS